jgi:hypothetical protein
MDNIKIIFITRIKDSYYLFQDKITEDIYYLVYTPKINDYDLSLFTYELSNDTFDEFKFQTLYLFVIGKSISLNFKCDAQQINKEEMFRVVIEDTT